jgi:hypothetical protein
MEPDRALLVLAAIILLVVVSNFVVFAIVRGMARGGGADWLSALKDSFRRPGNHPADKSMDELRKRVEELEKKKRG